MMALHNRWSAQYCGPCGLCSDRYCSNRLIFDHQTSRSMAPTLRTQIKRDSSSWPPAENLGARIFQRFLRTAQRHIDTRYPGEFDRIDPSALWSPPPAAKVQSNHSLQWIDRDALELAVVKDLNIHKPLPLNCGTVYAKPPQMGSISRHPRQATALRSLRPERQSLAEATLGYLAEDLNLHRHVAQNRRPGDLTRGLACYPSRISNCDPFPGSLLTVSRPPCSAMMRLVIARPSPVPPRLVE